MIIRIIWKELMMADPEFVYNVFFSMPNRISDVISNGGGSVNY